MLEPPPPTPVERFRTASQRRTAVSEDAAFFLVTALCAYGVAYALLILLHPFSEGTFVAVSDAAGIVPPALAGVLALFAGQMSGEHIRTGWRLIGAGCLAWAAGEAAWLVYEVVLGQDPFPSWADAGYLMMLPLVAGGLVLLTSEGRRLLRCQPTLDGIALTLALASLVWFFALQPTYASSSSSLIEKTIGAAYPVGDLVVCFALAIAVQRRWDLRDTMVLIALLGGMLLLVATDVGFAFQSLDGSYTATSMVNVGWPLGFLAIAAAAGLSAVWLPSFETKAQLTPPRPWRVALPLALLVPQLGLVTWSFREASLGSSVTLAALAAVTVLAVGTSMAISFGLVRELEASRERAVVWLDDFLHRKAA